MPGQEKESSRKEMQRRTGCGPRNRGPVRRRIDTDERHVEQRERDG